MNQLSYQKENFSLLHVHYFLYFAAKNNNYNNSAKITQWLSFLFLVIQGSWIHQAYMYCMYIFGSKIQKSCREVGEKFR